MLITEAAILEALGNSKTTMIETPNGMVSVTKRPGMGKAARKIYPKLLPNSYARHRDRITLSDAGIERVIALKVYGWTWAQVAEIVGFGVDVIKDRVFEKYGTQSIWKYRRRELKSKDMSYGMALNDPVDTEKPPSPSGRITMEQCLWAVSMASQVHVSDITSPRRNSWLIPARTAAAVLCYQLTSASLTMIGRKIKRDHSTIIYLLKRFQQCQKAIEIAEVARSLLEAKQ